MENKKTGYRHYSDEEINYAKEMDLLTYLTLYEPDNLVKLKGNVYCTREHDSLKISNGKWYWWSRGRGGKNAVSYLCDVKEMSFMEAVKTICREQPVLKNMPVYKPYPEQKKSLYLPEANENNDRVTAYLCGRGIAESIISMCIRDKVLYETKRFNNCCFIGKDESGTPKYGMVRGTGKEKFVQDLSGSDKRYSFRLTNENSDTLCVFEAAIDLLSYATILQQKGLDYNHYNLLSLSGVQPPGGHSKGEESLPAALESFLKNNPDIRKIALMLDSDEPGLAAAKHIKDILVLKYKFPPDDVKIAPPSFGKDYNEYLVGLKKRKEKTEPVR